MVFLKFSIFIIGIVSLALGIMLVAGGNLLETGAPAPIKMFEHSFTDPTPARCSNAEKSSVLSDGDHSEVVTGNYITTRGTPAGISIRAWISTSNWGDSYGCPTAQSPRMDLVVTISWWLKKEGGFGSLGAVGWGSAEVVLDRNHRWVTIPGQGDTMDPDEWFALELHTSGVPSRYTAYLSADPPQPYPYNTGAALTLWGDIPPPDEPEPPAGGECPTGQHWDEELQQCIDNTEGGDNTGGQQGGQGGNQTACAPGESWDGSRCVPPADTDITHLILLGLAVIFLLLGSVLIVAGLFTA